MNIGVNDGHTISGFGSGAVGIIKEGEHTRLVGAEVRRLIKAYGHNAINCTVDYANSVNQSLSLIMDQANRQDLDWFISIHFNAGGGEGVEVYTYEGRQYQDAIDVCNNISKLGFKNRGIKDGKGLYVVRRTKAKSMLIEVCFIDTADANHYLSVGYKAIA
ncbi:N-acetylmuramoyl-L-alanine amidase, partial [Clostridium tagluense]|uniref:N-acetylmuramoyl-L-alanine amidase n=1 Tax=Clostridium tagluense TaxID=360422 RepID=UPI0011CFFE83